MTSLNQSTDIPASIDTVEKLHAWTSQVLSYLYQNLQVQEVPNRLSRAIDVAPYESVATDPPTWRLIARSSTEIARDWQTGSGGLWEHAQEMGDEPIPEAFKS